MCLDGFLSVFSYRYAGMYLPRREGSAGAETLAVFRGTAFVLVAILARRVSPVALGVGLAIYLAMVAIPTIYITKRTSNWPDCLKAGCASTRWM